MATKTQFQPLSSLRPYKDNWKVKVFVTRKGSWRTYKNVKGQGCFFSVELTDTDGTQMQATMFNEAATKFIDKLETGKAYYISKGAIKESNKQYRTVANDYEMTLGQYSQVEEVVNESLVVPETKFNFLPLNQLEPYNNQKDLSCLLIDKRRDKMAAVVPPNLIQLYKSMNLEGHVFYLHHFKLSAMPSYYDYPKYENYTLCRGDWSIYITNDTTFTRLPYNIANVFPLYPLVPTMRDIARDRSRRKLLIDVVGKIIGGRRVDDTNNFELVLQDGTSHGIRFRLRGDHNTHFNHEIFHAMFQKFVIYVGRVKLVHLDDGNFLSSTAVTEVVFNPDMPKATNGAIKDI